MPVAEITVAKAEQCTIFLMCEGQPQARVDCNRGGSEKISERFGPASSHLDSIPVNSEQHSNQERSRL